MSKGPSPLIPLLLLAALGLLLRANSISGYLSLPSATEAENAVFTFIIFVPVLALLAIYSTWHTIVLPLALALGTYTVARMLLGPLMLILIAYAAAACLPSFKLVEEEVEWLCLVVLGFVLVQWAFSGEGRQSGAVVLLVVFFTCYHFNI